MEYFKRKCINIVVIVLGLIMALVPFVIAPVCPAMANGMYMSCHYSALLAMYCGIAVAIIAFVGMFLNNKMFGILINVLNLAIALAVILIPNKILKIQIGVMKNGMPKFMGYCMKDTMHCIANHTFVITTTISAIIAILSLGSLIYILMKKEK
ncbi:MAG: DUF4418 family protein [Parvimonas sp.]|uniref:DUF4418 family protein n=1 Tax=Parvimonas sp. TaxID=1944660 RepID=UPI0025D099C1|nr:DUF4418 family protein [Parvimonas sp.]MCI5998037.1 DUF4418 family protein [Parvimonas sp.]